MHYLVKTLLYTAEALFGVPFALGVFAYLAAPPEFVPPRFLSALIEGTEADKSEGCCIACMNKTRQRCGACKEAGFDLFFCSREHQKMVWFAHHRFCEKNAKPFWFPLFSKQEAELLEAEYKPVIAKQLEQGMSLDWMDRLLYEDAEGRLSLQDACQPPPFIIDRLEQQNPTSTAVKDFVLDLRNLRSISSLTMRLSEAFEPLAPRVAPYPVEENWYLTLLHQASIFVGLVHRVYVKPSPRAPNGLVATQDEVAVLEKADRAASMRMHAWTKKLETPGEEVTKAVRTVLARFLNEHGIFAVAVK
ncbi:hypothetical protein JCM8547_007703 [Rhodosporidiobolus lusitaniae]